MRSLTSKKTGKNISKRVLTRKVDEEKRFDLLMESWGAKRISLAQFRKACPSIRV